MHHENDDQLAGKRRDPVIDAVLAEGLDVDDEDDFWIALPIASSPPPRIRRIGLRRSRGR